MLYLIRVCGPSGWGLLIVTILAVLFIVRALLRRWNHGAGAAHGADNGYEYARHAILFWGAMGAVLGFLSQCAAVYAALTRIMSAEALSPAAVQRGFAESFIPSFWGFGLLAVCLLFWFVLDSTRGRAPARCRPAAATVLMAAALAVGHGCSSGDRPAAAITDGVWLGRAVGDEFYFEITADPAEGLGGVVHSLSGGKKYGEMAISRADWEDPQIELLMGATQVTYRGQVDLARGLVRGALHYADGSHRDMELRRVDPDQVPGLRARPRPAPGEPLYTYRAPADRNDGWATAAVAEAGFARGAIEALVTAVIEGQAGLLHSLLVVRDGRLVLEEYFHGYGADDLHRLASVTKSVSSLLVGLAVDQGRIRDLDVPLFSFFPQHTDLRTAAWERVTLRHLLTMSMGLDWSDEEAGRLHGTGEEFFRLVLARRSMGEPGTTWRYVSANVNLLAGVLRQATGLPADEFALRHLFGPLGIERFDWSWGAQDGYRAMDGALQLRPRDMAKLGQLVLDEGRWRESQIVSADWIRESTSARIPTGEPIAGYGYLWWVGSLPSPTGPAPVILANGFGSQFIAAFPQQNMVLVTTGGNDDNGKQFALAPLVGRYLLGAGG